jgi:hypothetical protein
VMRELQIGSTSAAFNLTVQIVRPNLVRSARRGCCAMFDWSQNNHATQ